MKEGFNSLEMIGGLSEGLRLSRVMNVFVLFGMTVIIAVGTLILYDLGRLKDIPSDLHKELEVIESRLSVAPKDVLAQVEELKGKVEESVLAKGQRDLLHFALEKSDDVVVGVNSRGIIDLWSNGAEKLFGVKRDEAVGFGIAFLVPPELRVDHRQKFHGVMAEEGGDVQQKEIITIGMHADGRMIPIKINVSTWPGVYAIAIITKRETG